MTDDMYELAGSIYARLIAEQHGKNSQALSDQMMRKIAETSIKAAREFLAATQRFVDEAH